MAKTVRGQAHSAQRLTNLIIIKNINVDETLIKTASFLCKITSHLDTKGYIKNCANILTTRWPV